MVLFPNGKYNDQVDSTSQALNWAKRHLWEPGIVGFYREQALQAYRDGTLTDFPKSLLKYIQEDQK